MGVQAVESTDQNSDGLMGPCGDKKVNGSEVDISLLPDGTFHATLPYLAPQQTPMPITVEGTATSLGKTTTLMPDAESIDATISTIGIDRCRGVADALSESAFVKFKKATLTLNKKQTSAKLAWNMSVVTTFQRPKNKWTMTTVVYTLKAAGRWAPAP